MILKVIVSGFSLRDKLRYPKIPLDFIRTFIALEKEKQEFYNFATFLEEEITKGIIDIRMIGPLFPEIVYIMPEFNKSLELYKTSSMISELAPIIIYFKYIISKNGFIIIEEPEAHLHPDAQRKFVRFIVKLIKDLEEQTGWKIDITDHQQLLALVKKEEKRIIISLGWIIEKKDFLNGRRLGYLRSILFNITGYKRSNGRVRITQQKNKAGLTSLGDSIVVRIIFFALLAALSIWGISGSGNEGEALASTSSKASMPSGTFSPTKI